MTNFPQWLGSSSAAEPTKVEDNSTFWLSNGDVTAMDNSQPTSAALDELLQHDDTQEWKTVSSFGETEADFALGDAGVPSLL
eukprot:jgi/Phyca11/510089/fgenesh2_kg.PHYCAscaffold_53_\